MTSKLARSMVGRTVTARTESVAWTGRLVRVEKGGLAAMQMRPGFPLQFLDLHHVTSMKPHA